MRSSLYGLRILLCAFALQASLSHADFLGKVYDLCYRAYSALPIPAKNRFVRSGIVQGQDLRNLLNDIRSEAFFKGSDSRKWKMDITAIGMNGRLIEVQFELKIAQNGDIISSEIRLKNQFSKQAGFKAGVEALKEWMSLQGRIVKGVYIVTDTVSYGASKKEATMLLKAEEEAMWLNQSKSIDDFLRKDREAAAAIKDKIAKIRAPKVLSQGVLRSPQSGGQWLGTQLSTTVVNPANPHGIRELSFSFFSKGDTPYQVGSQKGRMRVFVKDNTFLGAVAEFKVYAIDDGIADAKLLHDYSKDYYDALTEIKYLYMRQLHYEWRSIDANEVLPLKGQEQTNITEALVYLARPD